MVGDAVVSFLRGSRRAAIIGMRWREPPEVGCDQNRTRVKQDISASQRNQAKHLIKSRNNAKDGQHCEEHSQRSRICSGSVERLIGGYSRGAHEQVNEIIQDVRIEQPEQRKLEPVNGQISVIRRSGAKIRKESENTDEKINDPEEQREATSLHTLSFQIKRTTAVSIDTMISDPSNVVALAAAYSTQHNVKGHTDIPKPKVGSRFSDA